MCTVPLVSFKVLTGFGIKIASLVALMLSPLIFGICWGGGCGWKVLGGEIFMATIDNFQLNEQRKFKKLTVKTVVPPLIGMEHMERPSNAPTAEPRLFLPPLMLKISG